SVELSLEELEGLATTAFYQPVATITQKLKRIHPKTFLGSGKVEELLAVAEFHDAEVVIFDDNLSPGQNRNLENMLKRRVIDRSWLILEIFGDHAKSREAKAQVELARLKYALPRLTKMWGHLSRQRGGIGLREVGETQIQLDRRLIRDQIAKLGRKLKQIDRERQVQRKNRQDAFKVALTGYTNVGKSTLMNLLTGAGARVEDKLFATLDATTRKIKNNFPYPILVSDTVGLIEKLPHDLVASFKSTLDEVRNADLLIKLTDISHPKCRDQMQTTDQLLDEMGMRDTESLLVFNKIDKTASPRVLEDMAKLYPKAIFVSSLDGAGIPELQRAVTACYQKTLASFQVELNHAQSSLLSEIRKFALIVDTRYTETGVILDLKGPPHAKSKVAEILNGNAQFSLTL
ncbi:MAG: GTPase HflX, partial [Nitrospinales bacterium]